MFEKKRNIAEELVFWVRRIAQAMVFWVRRIVRNGIRIIGMKKLGLGFLRGLTRILALPRVQQMFLQIQPRLPASLRRLVVQLYIGVYSNPLRDQTASFNVDADSDLVTSRRFPAEVNKSGEFFGGYNAGEAPQSIGVVFLSVISWEFRHQRPQQLAKHLAKVGVSVEYLDITFGPEIRVNELSKGIRGVELAGPEHINLYSEPPTQQIIDSAVEYFKNRLKVGPKRSWVVVCQSPFWTPVGKELRKVFGLPLVYDCMDDHSGFSTNGENMLSLEEELTKDSDLVITSSRGLENSIAGKAKRSVIVRNAGEFEHFAPAIGDYEITSGRVGYYGALAEWFDGELLAEVASQLPQVTFELVGATFTLDSDRLVSQKNIVFLGESPYTDLPRLIEGWDLFVIPFKISPLTLATNPVKVYEMLATGKPVVATALPELLTISSLGLISTAKNATDFASAITEELGANSAEKQMARQGFARENTWDHRVGELFVAMKPLWPIVSVVIVTFNNRQLNELCLSSVLNSAYPNLEVIVVDNGSTDGTQELLDVLNDTRVKILKNQDNLGFSAANNQGLKLATGSFLVLLNNDTVCPPFLFDILIGHLQNNPELGLVGPVTNAIGNEARIPVEYENLRDLDDWAEYVYRLESGNLVDIDMLAFFCLAFSRETLEKIGSLDERFGIGMFEDDDYNKRVRTAGLQVKLAKDAFVHHWHHASFKLLGEEQFLNLLGENGKRFREKWQSEND